MNEALLQISAILRAVEKSLSAADWQSPPVSQVGFQDASTLLWVARQIASRAEKAAGGQGETESDS